MEKLLDYINILSERNIKKQSSSGFTLWALLGVVVFLTYAIFEDIHSIIKLKVQYNYAYLIIIGEFNFLYWLSIGLLSIILLLAPETKRAYSSLELFHKNVYTVVYKSIYTFFVFINLNAVYIAYHSKSNYLIYIFNAVWFISDIILTPVKKIIYFLRMKSKKEMSIVDIDKLDTRDELDIKTKGLNIAIFIFMIFLSVVGMILMASFFNVNIFHAKYLDINKVIIKMGAEIFLIFILIIFIIERVIDINKNLWLEILEKDIYLYNLSKDEIIIRLERDYIGSTPIGWLKKKKNEIIKINEEWLNYFDVIIKKLTNIDSEPISVIEKKKKYNMLKNEINKYNRLMRYKTVKIISIMLYYLKRNATYAELEDIKKIIDEALADKRRVKLKSDEVLDLYLKYTGELSKKQN